MDIQPAPTIASYLFPLAIVAVVMALRWRRMSRPRPLKLERLWVFPAIYAATCVALFAAHPPAGWAWAACATALALGAALGWQRGRMMRIALDPETHTLNQTGSPAAMLFLVVLVVARTGARSALGDGGMHLDPLALTDILMTFALGLFAATRAEMYIRGRRMLGLS